MDTTERLKEIIWDSDGLIVSITTAIESEFVLIPRDGLPEVTQRRNTSDYDVDGETVTVLDAEQALALVRLTTAIWQHLTAREAEAAKAEAEYAAKREQRRDDLARELTRIAYGPDSAMGNYANASNVTQAAIDRIIELEATK